METHFEGSRGSDHNSNSHQRQYDEQNPENINQMDADHREDFDKERSLTNDENADTNPNEVPDKPTFNRNESI